MFNSLKFAVIATLQSEDIFKDRPTDSTHVYLFFSNQMCSLCRAITSLGSNPDSLGLNWLLCVLVLSPQTMLRRIDLPDYVETRWMYCRLERAATPSTSCSVDHISPDTVLIIELPFHLPPQVSIAFTCHVIQYWVILCNRGGSLFGGRGLLV